MLACRVPKECPQEVADLYLRCLSSTPALRPEAAEVVDLLMHLLKSPGKGRPGLKPI